MNKRLKGVEFKKYIKKSFLLANSVTPLLYPEIHCCKTRKRLFKNMEKICKGINGFIFFNIFV